MTASQYDPTSELGAIRERYERRKGAYHALSMWVSCMREERERAIAVLLRKFGYVDTASLRLLEIGCGTGDNLLFFLRLGFEPGNLVGNELLDDRFAQAVARLPAAVSLVPGNAANLAPAGVGTFDIVFQATVFSSILDARMRQNVADAMWALVKPGGSVLWYDFIFDNPSNPDVRKVSIAQIRSLFPDAEFVRRRVTLAPPISRRVAPLGRWAYSLFNAFPFLRTHVVCCLRKPLTQIV